MLEKTDKKERSGKAKEKREKLSDEEKELRKERKLGRKRDRTEEALQVEMKRRREEEKAAKLSHQNGEIMEPVHQREKHHRSRDLSPYPRERSHDDRMELREKQYPFYRQF
jgi:THO complex subunit 2